MHLFTGKDAYAVGLCVGHLDLKLAFDDVAVQLVNLLEVNHSIKATVAPGVTFDEFQSWVKARRPRSSQDQAAKKVAELPFELAKAA